MGRPDSEPSLAGEAEGDPDGDFCGPHESGYLPGPSPIPAGRWLTVRVEFVVMGGPEGQALGRRQAEAMRKVLRWVAEHQESNGQ